MSFAQAAKRPRARGSASVRFRSITSAVSVFGKTKNSKWSFESASSSRCARTSASGRGSSTRWSVNAGTARSVTAVITPRAPIETRAARSMSPSAPVSSRTCPSAVTSSIASTWAEMLRSPAPVPCVPVEIAPATVWTSMSPRFSSARPMPQRCSFRACNEIPASTRTRPVSRSASSTRSRRSIATITPSVSAASVNECPVPGTRTVCPASRARPITSISSSRVPGRWIACGVQTWSPAQFRHSAAIRANLTPKSGPHCGGPNPTAPQPQARMSAELFLRGRSAGCSRCTRPGRQSGCRCR